MDHLRAGFAERFPSWVVFPDPLTSRRALALRLLELDPQERLLKRTAEDLLSHCFRLSGDDAAVWHWIMRSAGRNVLDLDDATVRREFWNRMMPMEPMLWLPFDVACRLVRDADPVEQRVGDWLVQRFRTMPSLRSEQDIRDWLQTGFLGDHTLLWLPDQTHRDAFFARFGSRCVPESVARRCADRNHPPLEPPVLEAMAQYLLLLLPPPPPDPGA